jgi:hypothetical protein
MSHPRPAHGISALHRRLETKNKTNINSRVSNRMDVKQFPEITIVVTLRVDSVNYLEREMKLIQFEDTN